MNIIIVIPTLTVGGAERLAIATAEALNRHGNKVTLISLSSKGESRPRGGVGLHVITQKNKVLALVKFIKKNNIQGCVSYLERANMFCSLACWLTNIKYCASVHTAPVAAFKKRNLLNRVVIKLTYSFISLINAKVICVAQGIKNDMSLLYKIENSRVINNFIDYQDVDKKTQNDTHNDREFDYIFVGRLAKVKGCDVLIDALCEMSIFIKDNNLNIAIIGDGDERQKLQGEIERFGISKFVSFKGECEDPYIYMKKAKYIIVPSYAEGFGLVVLEGLYLGADIIYSKCDFGPREIIDNYFPEQKKLGFSDPSLNRIESVAELSSIIKYTFNSKPVFLSHENKKERVREYFNREKVASDIYNFLND